MANVPAGFTIPLPGSAAVPSGWTRATELDGRHPLGAAAGADPGVTAGADTHTHASPVHSHTVGSHQHTGGTSGGSPTPPTSTQTGGSPSRAVVGHTHSAGTSGLITGTLANFAASFGTSPNDPPFYTVRWIRSNGTPTGIPAGAWTYWDAAALPASWSSPAAVRTKYLKGAAAGANGDTTGGSSGSHSHTASAHTHAFSPHTHTGGASGVASGAFSGSAGSVVVATSDHTHVASFTAQPTTAASGSQTSASSGSTSSEVAFTTLGIVQNDTGGVSLPVGVIGVWLGLLSAIPLSMAACNGSGGTVDTRGKYVKGADISAGSFTGIGTTGGTANHDHTDPAGHTHDAAHTHTVALASTASATGTINAGAVFAHSAAAHSHAGFESGSAGGTSGSTAQTVDAASHDPSNITVIYVKYTGSIDVTITSPADGATITTPSGLALTWTLSAGTQSNKRVIIYASDQATVIFDSGVVVDTAMSYSVPSTAGLRTAQTYYYQVIVTNNSGIPGGSNLQSFVTAWTPPSTLTGLTVTEIGA